MAIKPKCDFCRNELVQFGGILLSPPDEKNQVIKYHVCIDCFKKITPNKD